MVDKQEEQKNPKYADNKKPACFICRDRKLPIGKRTLIMGILNVTPDSFSDGGSYCDVEHAVKRAKEMCEEGADIIDVGGESTRPGYTPVDASEEIRRILPVVERLVSEIDVPISIDTHKAVVADKALSAGAHMVNDIWGLQKDPAMAGVAARYGAGVVLMHNRDEILQNGIIMEDIINFLRNSIAIAEKAGIDRRSMIVDPGIGFGKTLEQNLETMNKLEQLQVLDLPVLLGTSRKSIVGRVLNLPVNERLEGTAATVALGIAKGVDIIRVHDVKEMARVARMTDAMVKL